MKSRRLRRHRNLQRQARSVVDTYRNSSRGLMRVFSSILAAGDPSGGAAPAGAAHHHPAGEAPRPQLRAALRSCRYPGAEHGDTNALLWGLWGQLSEAQLHLRGALESLQALGRLSRPPSPPSGIKDPAAAKRARKKPGAAKRAPKTAKKAGKPAGRRKSGPRSGR